MSSQKKTAKPQTITFKPQVIALHKTVVVRFKTALEAKTAAKKLNQRPASLVTSLVKSIRGKQLLLSSLVERRRGKRLMLPRTGWKTIFLCWQKPNRSQKKS
jgi:hypothetical protein